MCQWFHGWSDAIALDDYLGFYGALSIVGVM
jgi:hypothetical protein